MTTPEENKALVRRLNDMWQGDLEIVDELVAADYTNHNPIDPDAPPGPEGFKQNVAVLLSAFPDLDWTLEDVIAERDRVVIRTIGHGTHHGEFMGVEPTGREVALAGIVIFRIDDGQIVERWAQFDTMGLLRQVGALPASGAPSGAGS